MGALFTLSFLLPAKAHANQKLHSRQHATVSRKNGKQQKESLRGLELGIRQASASPPPKRRGRQNKPLLGSPDPGSPAVGRTLYLPFLAHPCARVLQDTWEVSGGRSGEALENAWSRVGRALTWDGDTKREREFAGVTGENKSAKEESENWRRRCG